MYLEKKETKTVKHRILRDIKNLFEHEKQEENSYKPLWVNKFWSKVYIEYESNRDRNQLKTISWRIF